MTTVFKLAKAGKSVGSTNPEDFIFHSEYASVKIVQQNEDEEYDTATVPASSYVDVTITHNLGFIPMVMLYTEPTPSSGRWYMGCAYYTPATEDTYVTADGDYTYVDDTYFKFRIYNNTSSQKIVKYYFYIFGDSAE